MQKLTTNNGAAAVVQHYVNGVEYIGNTLERLPHTEGEVVKDGSGNYLYEYTLKDHLGNTRVTFSDADNNGVVENSDIKQINHYYPFGLNMEGPGFGVQGANKYGYNGKELNTDFGLGWNDYGARWYQSDDGRWLGVDPLTEEYHDWSPYHYGMNNPIKFIDPTGMASEAYNSDMSSSAFASTHTNSQGKVIAVYDDGDLGVYKHDDAETQEDVDKKREKTGTKSGGGKYIGQTDFWDEFINPDKKIPDGKLLFNEDDDEHSWDAIISWMFYDAMKNDFTIISEQSKLTKKYDLKNNKDWAGYGIMTGRKLNGKWASARSAGNYLAGMNGRYGTFQGNQISMETYLKLAGALQQGTFSKLNAFKIIAFKISFGPAPYYGEEPYSGRRIVQGWKANKPTQKTP